MKIKIYYIGRDKKNHHSEAEALYLKRLKSYVSAEIIAIPPPKFSSSLSGQEIKDQEALLLLKHLGEEKSVFLMDEKGKTYNSMSFSKLMEQQMAASVKNLIFVIGGAYGLGKAVKEKYKQTLRLSDLTFSHHLARTVLLEQIYRAYTILNNEPYHNK